MHTSYTRKCINNSLESAPMNIVIIGAGPAGEAAAKAAKKTKPDSNVILIEKEHPGGLCLNKGCIPSKSLLEYVHNKTQNNLPIDWKELQTFKNHVVTTIRGQLAQSLKTLKINLINGTAAFESPSTLRVTTSGNSEVLPFDKAIIAAGTEPIFPPPLDQHRKDLLDSDKALELTQAPSSILIVGGGAVGCEFACLLQAAGSKVTLLELKENLLPGEDAAVAQALAKSFETRGIKVITGAKVNGLQRSGAEWKAGLSNGEIVTVTEILVCVGRSPRPALLSVDKAGVQLNGTSLKLNEKFQTTNPHIYAAGDAATTRLAHAAAHQGEAAAQNALGGTGVYDDRFVPRCLYSWPEVASVGQWKYQLEEAGKPVKTSRAFFQASAKALAAREPEGFVQIVFDPSSDRVLGAQIIGAHATELIHIFSVALKKDMTRKELADVMFAHPTLSETIKEACKK